MKKRIEYRELKIMGASKKALDFYSNSDPLNIYKVGDTYRITGIIECECDSDAELIATLDEYAAVFETEE